MLLRFALVAIVAGLAAIPTAGLALDPDKDFPSPGVCRPGQDRDSHGNPCIRPNRPLSVLQAKTDAANAYHRFLTGEGSKEEVERADYVASKVSGEDVGKSDWSLPQNTPAARKLRGEQVPRDYGPLQNRFWPFEQINWWYCGPATAQSILWYLGPHRSETVDPEWGGRPWLTGNPYEDQWLLGHDFWLATNSFEGTNWGDRYMPFTLNAWRGTSWYVQSASPFLEGGTLTKEQALINMRYDFDRSYPVAENVLYAPSTYYPYGFWPGIVYLHWDVVYGYLEDDGLPYVQIGQVYHDERFSYERFQQVSWDVHWGAIANWHGIVW